MPAIGNGPLPVLVTTAGIGALATLSCSVPNDSCVGSSVNVGTTPFPLSGTLCVPPPLRLTLSVDVCAPAKVGVNTTLITHVPLTGTVVPQLLVCENCKPESVMFVIGNATLPVLVNVTVCGALATAICWLPNDTGEGATVNMGWMRP